MHRQSAIYKYVLGSRTFEFKDLKDLMAKATPARSGDRLSGVAAENSEQRVVAQMLLAELPLKTFLEELLIPYE
ncbi:MAG: ethanolamine ammonia-lyase large subunit, partial [Psychrobacter glaciei]